jgi:heme exporter protein B
MIQASLTILLKDLRLDLRRVENFFSLLFFTVTILLIFAFALPPQLTKQVDVLSGMYWITFLLSGILCLNKSFQLEKDNGCMYAVLVSPISRGALFIGKMLATIMFIMVVQGLVIPVFGIMFNSVVFTYLTSFLLLSLLAATGFSALGTLLAGLTSDIRFKEILLPLLLFPLLIPLLLACVKLTQAVLTGAGLAGAADWLRLLIGFDLIFFIVSYLTFEFVMEL